MNVLDLFSGIGGFSLGLESTGYFKTIAFVEKDEFCQKVLQKNFPNIPIESEIRNVKGSKYKADIITGGFPCQPFSVAGKRKGTDDDRYLWDETIRVIAETKPKWFIGENVDGIININNGLVLRQVQTDLEKEGFQVQCLVIPASGIGAWHQRKRIWIIANNISNSNCIRHRGWSSKRCENEKWSFFPEKQKRREMGSEIKRCNRDVSHSDNKRCKESNISKKSNKQIINNRKYAEKNVRNTESTRRESSFNRQREGELWRTSKSGLQCKETWWQTQSRICGVPNGISHELDKYRKDRIKSLGNSIVPQIARELGLAIIKAEQNVQNTNSDGFK